MAKENKTRAPKKRKDTDSDNTYDSGLNLSTDEPDDHLPTMDEEGMEEDANIESGTTGGHEDNVSSHSSVGGDHRGWGRGVGGGGGNAPRPATTVDPAANSILKIFKRSGIEHKCAACMLNVEKFMSSSDLVSLENRNIESICAINCRDESHAKTYILGTGEKNLKLDTFEMKHLESTGRSCDTTSVYKPYVISFKDQQRRVYTHHKDQITAPVLTNRMLDKELDRTWELIDEHLSCMHDNNGTPISEWNRATVKLIPKPDSEDPATDYVTFDRELIERAPIIQKY